jgi:hypothetical protein
LIDNASVSNIVRVDTAVVFSSFRFRVGREVGLPFKGASITTTFHRAFIIKELFRVYIYGFYS